MTGWLRKADMRECVRGLLGGRKSVAQQDDLFDALDADEPHEMVQYARLFEEDADLNQVGEGWCRRVGGPAMGQGFFEGVGV